MLITFEGGEGAGKSTQIKKLEDALLFSMKQSHGGFVKELYGKKPKIILTREPGGTDGAEQIRDLLVHGDKDQWTDNTECLLMNASRAEHVARLIAPNLAKGNMVISDRFMDSTRAYQGYAGGMDMDRLKAVEHVALNAGEMPVYPDVTFILDISPEVGLSRAASRGGAARFEAKGLAYHEKVRQGFLAIAEAEKDRCIVIDASKSEELIHTKIWVKLQSKFKKLDMAKRAAKKQNA